MEIVVMEEGVASNFKSIMQNVYSFLVDGEKVLDSCDIIEKLGFDEGNIASCKSSISTLKSKLNDILNEVLNCQDELLSLDESGSKELDTVFEFGFEDEGEKTTKKKVTTGGGGGGVYVPPTTSNPPETNPVVIPINPEKNPYQFSEDTEEAFRMGDIFIEDEISLTKFTNLILKKYGIEDEARAKKLYEAVLVYGNEYYYENGQNPLTNVDEGEVLSSIYDIIKNDTESTFKASDWKFLKEAIDNGDTIINSTSSSSSSFDETDNTGANDAISL